MLRALSALAAAAWMLAPSGSSAHSMPNSTVAITFTTDAIEVEGEIPLSELGAAVGRDLSPADVPAARPDLEAYLRLHVAVRSLDGALWRMAIEHLGAGEHAALNLSLRFNRPPGARAGAIQFDYDAVSHAVASHYILVYVRDRAEPDVLRPAARLQIPVRSLRIEPPAP